MPDSRRVSWITTVTRGLPALLALAITFTIPPAEAAAAPVTMSCDNFYNAPVSDGRYRLQNNVWNDDAGTQCLRTTGARFELTRSNHRKPVNGPPASYASLYKGCHYRTCSAASGLPQRVDRMQRVRTDWNSSNVTTGAYNTSLDLWFDPRPNFPGINAGEIMVWLNHRGGPQPAGSRMGQVRIDGTAYDLWKGVLRDGSRNISWVVVTYVRRTQVTAVAQLDLRNITRDATRRNYIRNGWYLNSVQAGFEVWRGGKGLRTNSFHVYTR